MSDIREELRAVIDHLDDNYEPIHVLPFEARNLITNTYSVLVDLKEDGNAPESGDDDLSKMLTHVDDYINQADTSEVVREEMERIVKPVRDLSTHLTFNIAYGTS